MAWARWVSLAVIPLAAGSLAVAAWAVGAGVGRSALSWLFLTILMASPALVFGHLITRRLPRHSVGALLSGAGLLMLAVGASDIYLAAAQAHPGLPVSNLAISLIQGSWMLLYLPWALMLLIFPSGRFESRGAGRIAGSLLATAAVFAILVALSASTYANEFQEKHRGLGPVVGADVAAVLLLPLFLLLLVFSFVNVVRRFKRADATVKNQIRWLAVAGASVPGTLLLCWIGYLSFRDPSVVILGLAAMNIFIPCVLGLALLRPALLDAGHVLVSLASSIALLALVMVWTVLLIRWPGVESAPAAVLTVSAAAVGTLLVAGQGPRLRRRIGRILYAEHERILDALTGLHTRVFANAARPAELESVLRTATGDTALRVGYAGLAENTFVDVHGSPVDGSGGIPVTLMARVAGVIVPGAEANRQGGQTFNAAVLKALSPMVEMGRQQLELAAALADVDASRSRLLVAAHEESRRLERDLHDGAQQRLIALGMGLRLIQHQLPLHSKELHDQLDASVTELGTAVAELRQLAHGVRPSALDDGLPAALRQLSGRSPTPLTLHIAEPLPEVPEIVVATAYFVASEAVHNATRHAQAQRISIVLKQRGASISLLISDDGRGGARCAEGGGLAGLTDRVNALGGELRLTSPEGHGTTLEALLPCG